MLILRTSSKSSVSPACCMPALPIKAGAGRTIYCKAASGRLCATTADTFGCLSCQAVEGNTALALLLTSGSNLLGILTMPFMLCAVLGAGDVGGAIKPIALLITLVQSILVPLSLGAGMRAFVPGETPHMMITIQCNVRGAFLGQTIQM